MFGDQIKNIKKLTKLGVQNKRQFEKGLGKLFCESEADAVLLKLYIIQV